MKEPILQFLSICFSEYMQTESYYLVQTKRWIEKIVIGLNLCPFAKKPFFDGQISYKVNQEDQLVPLVNEVIEESMKLNSTTDFETSLIILPGISLTFENFNDFILDLQELLDKDQEYQMKLIAFHPEFRYADSQPDETANATNRSPYPMIHILKKSSLEIAKNSQIDIPGLLINNKNRLSSMSWEEIRLLYS